MSSETSTGLEILTVACVLRSGGDFNANWVRKLHDGVKRNLGPHRFVCLSDVDVPCERIPLLHKWPGWWSKLELFLIPGPLLYFDLDTVIVGDLREIGKIASKKQLTAIQPFYRPDGLASGMMAWNGQFKYVYDLFNSKPERWMETFRKRGDQMMIGNIVPKSMVKYWQDETPSQLVSYKVHVKGEQLPENARVVAFHGKPRPNAVFHGWLKEHWS